MVQVTEDLDSQEPTCQVALLLLSFVGKWHTATAHLFHFGASIGMI